MPILHLPTPLESTAAVTFDLKSRIGSGGEAEVFLAHDRQLNAPIAIKRIPVVRFNGNVAAYFSESQKLYLTRHHNIVDILYAGQDADYVYVAMPYYEKGSVLDLINSRFLTSKEIIRYSLQFLSGLNNVHSKRLLHFDIKCENLLLSNNNQALLSDFGLAQYTNHFGFASSGTTPLYAPPEYFSQVEHNVLFDIYQAGLTMYRMAIGQKAFQSELDQLKNAAGLIELAPFIAILSAGKFPKKNYPEHIPKSLRKVINNALNTNPNDRYNNVIDILNDLSVIDDAKNWQHVLDSTSGEQKWTDGAISITAKEAIPGTWNIEGRRISTGNRAKPLCKNGLNLSQKNSLIYKGIMGKLKL